MKFGIDVHGVITDDPTFFRRLTRRLHDEGHEVHIITGVELGSRLDEELRRHGISYTQLFSITSYHKQIGTYIVYKDGDPTQPLIAPPKWDRTKADYCAREGIDLMIDDSHVYGTYFNDIGATQYIQWTPAFSTFIKEIIWAYI